MYLRLIAINPTVVGEIAGDRRAKSQRPSERGNRVGTTKMKAPDLGALWSRAHERGMERMELKCLNCR